MVFLEKRTNCKVLRSREQDIVPYCVSQLDGKPFDDMMRRVPCLDRINETVGYEPKTSLEEILQAVIEDIKNRI